MEIQKAQTNDNQVLADVGRTAAGSDLALLAAAYVEAAGEIDNVVKNANNPHFGSNYADLGAVLDTVKPVFHRHGLALLQSPGTIEGDKISLQWVLMHRSGQRIAGTSQLPIGAKQTAQAAGSAITYARRYQASAIGGIAQVDDDGNAASSEAPPKKAGKKAEKEKDAGEYSEAAAQLLEEIEAAGSVDALTTIKDRVKELGDEAVAKAYVARKNKLKEAV